MKDDTMWFPEAELEKELAEYTRDWNPEELFALYTECTTLISSTKSRIRELASQGCFSRITGFLNGKNKKRNIDIADKTNRTLKLFFAIIRIVLDRIDTLNGKLDGLKCEMHEHNAKTNNRIIDMKKQLNMLEREVERLRRKEELKEWMHESSANFAGFCISETILHVVSQIFDLTEGRCDVGKDLLQHYLFTELKLRLSIKSSEFYGYLIENRQVLSLLNKEKCIFDRHLSVYGRVIFHIASFYERDPRKLLDEVERRQMIPAELCRRKYETIWCRKIPTEIPVFDLCENLIGDLRIARGMFLALPIPDEGMKKSQESARPAEVTGRNQSLWVLGAAGIRIFRGKKSEDIFFQQEQKHNLISHEQEADLIDQFCQTKDEKMVVVLPTPYITGGEAFLDGYPDFKEISYVSMADYYMYLWYKRFGVQGTDSEYVIIMEEYDKKISATEFRTTEHGYQICAKADGINCRRTGNHLLSDLAEKNFFRFVQKENAVFLIVTDHRGKVEERLSKKEVTLIEKEESWESCLKDSEKFCQRMEELMELAEIYQYDSTSHKFYERQS